MGWEERITVNPAVRSGKPCIKGTRTTVYDVLEYLAGGMTEDQILGDFPDLTRDDMYIHYRAQSCQRGGNLEVRVGRQSLRVPAAMKGIPARRQLDLPPAKVARADS